MRRLILLFLSFFVASSAFAGFKNAVSTGSGKIDWDSAVLISQNVGWYPSTVGKAGNYAFNTSGGLNALSTYKHTLPNGGVIDVVAKQLIDRPSAASAVGKFFAKSLAPLAVGFAAYDLVKDLGWDVWREPDKMEDEDGGLRFETEESQSTCPTDSTLHNGICKQALSSCGDSWSSFSNAVLLAAACNRTLEFKENGVIYTEHPSLSQMYIEYRLLGPPTIITVKVPKTFAEFIQTITGSTSVNFIKSIADAVISGQNVDPLSNTPPSVSGPSSAPGPVTTTQNPDGTTTTTTTTYNPVYQGNEYIINNTTNVTNYNPVTNTTTNVSSSTVTNNSPPKTESDCDKYPNSVGCLSDKEILDSPLPALPQLYEPKYPDGPSGVINDKITQLKSTGLYGLINGLIPNWGDSGGCPSWPVNVDLGKWNFGTFDASPPCSVWSFMRIVMIIGALFLARALIFGG